MRREHHDHQKHRLRFGTRARWAGASLFALTLALAAGQAAAADPAPQDPAAAEAPPQDFPAPAGKAAAVTGGDGIGEVVVTARRRQEKLQDVPIPITVIGGDVLANAGSVRMEDIGRLLPSTNITVNNPRQNSIAVRGLGNNPASDGLEPSVGVFLDGVYLSRPGMAIFDLNDIDQFELLRGPQGTLFGKNTTAGAFNITTKRPSFTPEATAELTLGNYSDREFRATANTPLTDTQAVRLSLYSTERDGTLNNLTLGKDQLDRKRLGLRGQWLYDDKKDFDLRVIAEYHQEHDSQGLGSQLYRTTPGAGVWAYQQSLRNHTSTYNFPANGYDIYDRNVYIDGLQDMKVNQFAFSGEANWKLDNGYRLTSITAFRQWNFSPYNDGDGTNLDIIRSAGAQNHTGQLSQEVRFSSPTGGLFDYTAGLFLFDARSYVNQYTAYGNNTTLLADYFGTYNYTTRVFTPNAAQAARYAGQFVQQRADLVTDSYAGFFQGNLHPTQDLTLTAGTRYTYEHKSVEMSRNLGSIQTAAAEAINPRNGTASAWLDSYSLAGTLAANYKVVDGFNLFATASHGAKAGAMNNLLPNGVQLTRNALVVAPEKINEIDLGFKSQFFDRKVSLDANLYYGLVENYQATGLAYNPASGTRVATLINTGWVTTKGAELDASVRPFPGLKLTAGGSYNLATYRSYRQGTCAAEYQLATTAVCDLTGREVQGAPRWIGSLSAEYNREIEDGIEAYIGTDYQYRSWAYGTADDSAYGRIEGYGLVNLRLGTRLFDGALDLSGWVHNLFDKTYVVSVGGGGNLGAYTAQLGDPLTFGVTARAKF